MSNRPPSRHKSSPPPITVYGSPQQVTKIFLWFIALMLVSLTAGIFILLSNNNIAEAVFTGIIVLPILLSLVLVRRQKFDVAAMLMALTTISLMTLLATRGQGVHNISILGFPAVLIIASLVTRKRTMALLTLFSVGCVAWLVFGELAGLYSPNPILHSLPGDFFSVTLVLVATAVMVRLISESMFHANQQLQTELKERERVQERLRANELFLRAIINNIPFDLWVCDAEGRYIIQNAISYRLAGNLNGKTVDDLDLPPDVHAEFKDKHQRALSGQKVSEEVVMSIGSEERYMLSVQAPVYDNREILGFVGMNIDMTEHKRVEEELRVSQERFALAVEGANDGIWDWDMRTNTSYASPRWYGMLGYAPGELEHGEGADLLLRLMHPDDQEHFLEMHRDYLEGRIPTYELEFRLRHKDGEYRWILSRGKALWDEHGQPYRMTGSHTDITERKRAEQVQMASRQIAEAALTQNLEEFYQSVYAIISPLIPARNFYLTLYDEGSDTFSVPFLADEFDSSWPTYRPGKGLGAHVLRTGEPLLVNPETFAEMERQGLVEIITRRMVEWLGVPLKTRQGKIIGVMAAQNYSGEPRLNASHMELMVFVSAQVAMAIERKQAEEKLEQRIGELATVNAVSQVAASQLELNTMIELTGEKLRQIQEVDSLYIALYDPQSGFISFPYWRSFGEIVQAPQITLGEGLTSRVINNRKPLIINHDFDRRGAKLGAIHRKFSGTDRRPKSWMGIPMQVGEQVIGILGIQNFEKEFAFSEDDVRLWTTIASNVAIAIQNAQLYTAVQQELAKRKMLIEELEAKNAELEQFTYTVSHDLKSPIITISGFLGYLERDALSGDIERLKSDISRIQDATGRMKTLLDELLELSRVGRLMNPPQEVAFSDLVRDALEIVQGRLDAGRIKITIQPDLPTIFGDCQRLTEALQNLLDNAAKFMGEQPDPHIEIGQRGEEDGKPVFFVRDNGIGIAPEYHERIFGLFNKLDPKAEGTGVGLTLVRRIVEVHGGRIWVESEVGKGATFCFTLRKRQDVPT